MSNQSELDEILNKAILVTLGRQPLTDDVVASARINYQSQVKQAIQAIIRTEKIKLLAEVRERAEMVVGNVFDPSGEYVSVSEIDKLEAEL